MLQIKQNILQLEKIHGRNVHARRAFNNMLRGGGMVNLSNKISQFFTNKKNVSETSKSNLIITFKVGHDEYKVEIELYDNIVPKTTKNFRTIATKGINNKTYNGCIMHRVIKDFMIQGGDILNGDGTGVISIYGNSFDDENFVKKHDKPGLLSMANAGPNTNGSQFFITTAPATHLDGKHVVFGEVIKGLEHIHMLENVPTDKKDRPHDDIIIASILLSEDNEDTSEDTSEDTNKDNKNTSKNTSNYKFSLDLKNYLKHIKTNVINRVKEEDINADIAWPEVNDESYTVKGHTFYKDNSDSQMNDILVYAMYLLCIENVEEESIWKNIIVPVSDVDPVDCYTMLITYNVHNGEFNKGPLFKDFIQIKNFKSELPSDPEEFYDVFTREYES